MITLKQDQIIDLNFGHHLSLPALDSMRSRNDLPFDGHARTFRTKLFENHNQSSPRFHPVPILANTDISVFVQVRFLCCQ